MGSILEIVECSTAKDGERFENIIRDAIKEGIVPTFKMFEKSVGHREHEKRIMKELKEEKEFQKLQEKEKNKKEESSLLALIQKNAQNRQCKMNSIIESIETTARGKTEKRKRGIEEVCDLPSDEEFFKLQEKMFKKQKK